MDSCLDLSHLTETEQGKILQVLQRDLNLRLLDEGRVRSEVTAPPQRFQLCMFLNRTFGQLRP